jgi:hypothetical protein
VLLDLDEGTAGVQVLGELDCPVSGKAFPPSGCSMRSMRFNKSDEGFL